MVSNAFVHKHLCLDTGHVAATGEYGIGDHGHQSFVGSAIHQSVAIVRNPYAKFLNGFLIYGIVPLMRAEIHGDVHTHPSSPANMPASQTVNQNHTLTHHQPPVDMQGLTSDE